MQKIWLLFLPLTLVFLIPPKAEHYKYEIAIVAIFQDEAPWLKEWIEFHRLLGVEHFRLYNNESQDNYLEVLEPYLKSGVVTLIDWPTKKKENGFQEFVQKTQIPAYRDGVRALKGIAKWVAFIDIDEFIVPHKENDLKSFLAPYQKYGGVAIHWVCFGTSHLQDIPSDKLLIETLLFRSKNEDETSYYEKSIVRPEYVKHVVDPHYFFMQKRAPLVNANFEPHVHLKTVCHDKIQINHYHTRTLRYFWDFKIAKKQKMDNSLLSENEILHLLSIGNHHLDEEKVIFKFIPELKRRMEQ